MKVNWRQVLRAGLGVGKLFLPAAVSVAIDHIEDNVAIMVADGKAGWSGPEKQAAALDTLMQAVAASEGLTAKDLLHDPTVLAAGQKSVDAVLASKKALAELQQAIATFKASKNPPAAPDSTGQP